MMPTFSKRAESILRKDMPDEAAFEKTGATFRVGDRFSACVVCRDLIMKENSIKEVEQAHRQDDFFSFCLKHHGRVVDVWIVKSVSS